MSRGPPKSVQPVQDEPSCLRRRLLRHPSPLRRDRPLTHGVRFGGLGWWLIKALVAVLQEITWWRLDIDAGFLDRSLGRTGQLRRLRGPGSELLHDGSVETIDGGEDAVDEAATSSAALRAEGRGRSDPKLRHARPCHDRVADASPEHP